MLVEALPTAGRPAPSAPAGEAGGPARAPRRRLRALGRHLVPLLYIAPAFALLVLWTYRPLAQTFQLSFYDWNMVPSNPMTPVGLDNYREVLALPEMWQAIRTTALYIGALLVFSTVLPVVIALLTRRVGGRARGFYQALIFVPVLITPVATAAVWRWLLAPEGGPLTTLLSAFGMEPVNWFRDPQLAVLAVVLITGWQLMGFGVLVVAAGLTGIGPDYAAAASTDGATAWQTTRWITLPLLSPTLVFLALMTLLLSAQWTFPVIDVLTQGGPGNATSNVYHLLWQFGFRNFDAGLSAAAGVLFFVAFTLVALLFVKLMDRLSFYDD
ncbi:sugar ABC transporter permease [Streptomyces sp. RFCAC02]|uniref:carbohydrate ABC transporter permease n=1 Tax=Streptomyces sp. RFCAC02 TaxID=2499143 RepID=UPI0019D0F89B|nr:sugar ABC transporter permease [Streptomyces sp. RFCAC02]